jgi:hypothetical protein
MLAPNEEVRRRGFFCLRSETSETNYVPRAWQRFLGNFYRNTYIRTIVHVRVCAHCAYCIIYWGAAVLSRWAMTRHLFPLHNAFLVGGPAGPTI